MSQENASTPSQKTSTTQAPAYLTEPRYLKELAPLSTIVSMERAAALTSDPILADLLHEVKCHMFRLRDHLSGRPIRSTYAAALVASSAARDALELCYQIERCGCSDELTKASIMASDLRAKLASATESPAKTDGTALTTKQVWEVLNELSAAKHANDKLSHGQGESEQR